MDNDVELIFRSIVVDGDALTLEDIVGLIPLMVESLNIRMEKDRTLGVRLRDFPHLNSLQLFIAHRFFSDELGNYDVGRANKFFNIATQLSSVKMSMPYHRTVRTVGVNLIQSLPSNLDRFIFEGEIPVPQMLQMLEKFNRAKELGFMCRALHSSPITVIPNNITSLDIRGNYHLGNKIVFHDGLIHLKLGDFVYVQNLHEQITKCKKLRSLSLSFIDLDKIFVDEILLLPELHSLEIYNYETCEGFYVNSTLRNLSLRLSGNEERMPFACEYHKHKLYSLTLHNVQNCIATLENIYKYQEQLTSLALYSEMKGFTYNNPQQLNIDKVEQIIKKFKHLTDLSLLGFQTTIEEGRIQQLCNYINNKNT
ncbi:Cntrl, partial [Acrasis kona]